MSWHVVPSVLSSIHMLGLQFSNYCICEVRPSRDLSKGSGIAWIRSTSDLRHLCRVPVYSQHTTESVLVKFCIEAEYLKL